MTVCQRADAAPPRLTRNFADNSVEGGPLRCGSAFPPYDAPRKFYRPEEPLDVDRDVVVVSLYT